MLIIQSSHNQLKQRKIISVLIGYLDEVIRPLVLILPKMSGYAKTFKDKGGADKNRNNRLTSQHIDCDKLLEK